jgi:hypothetical protein
MTIRKQALAVTLVVATAGVALAAATLTDFKEAQGKEGCDSIPYSTERGDCKRYAVTRDEYCKGGKGPWNCEALNPAGLLKQIENVNGKIVDLKREKDDLNNKRNSATDDEKRDIDGRITKIDDEIYKLTQLVDEWKRKLYEEKKAIDDRIYVGEQCLSARKSVAGEFNDAISYAKSETDPDIVAIAKDLVAYWETKQREHEKAMTDTEAGIKKCRDMR